MLNFIKEKIISRWYIILPAILLFIYIILRAVSLSFTHDEAFTFLNYVTRPSSEIINVNYTNNHLLNSLLTRIAFLLFGSSEFSLRLPNVLAAILFIFYLIKLLLKILPGKITWLLAFVAITLNSFQDEFFGLCRGYGLSLGLIMMSFYFIYRYVSEQRSVRLVFISILCMFLATLANYSILIMFLIHVTAVLYLEIKRLQTSRENKLLQIKRRNIKSVILLLSSVVFAFILLKLIVRINAAGNDNFNFGGTKGFWQDTVCSLVSSSCISEWRILYHWTGELFPVFMTGFVIIVFVIASGLLLKRILLNAHSANNLFSFYLFVLLTGCGSAIWLMNVILKIPFSTDRVAIYFIPVFSLFVCSILLSEGNSSRIRKGLACLFFIHPVFSFCIGMNLHISENWKFNANNADAFNIIISDSEKQKCSGAHYIVSTDYLMYPVYDYYRFRFQKSILSEVVYSECGFRNGSDFYLGNSDPGISFEKI